MNLSLKNGCLSDVTKKIFGFLERSEFEEVTWGCDLGGMSRNLEYAAGINKAWNNYATDYCQKVYNQPLSTRIIKNRLNSVFYPAVPGMSGEKEALEEILRAIVEGIEQSNSAAGESTLKKIITSNKVGTLTYVFNAMNINHRTFEANLIKKLVPHLSICFSELVKAEQNLREDSCALSSLSSKVNEAQKRLDKEASLKPHKIAFTVFIILLGLVILSLFNKYS